jgi:hypothetical protein
MDPAKKPTIAEITSRLIKLILNMPPEERARTLQEIEARQAQGKRRSVRETYFVDVNYATKERVYKGFIQNISPEGVYVETREPVVVGQKITLAFPLPHSLEHAKVGGEIVRSDANGFGVKFDAAIQELLENGQVRNGR